MDTRKVEKSVLMVEVVRYSSGKGALIRHATDLVLVAEARAPIGYLPHAHGQYTILASASL